MSEIIGKGKLIRDGDRATLQYIKDDKIFKIGLKGNWKGESTHNKWVITAYKDEREVAKTIESSDFTKGETLPLNSSDIIPQNIKDSITMQSNAHLGSGVLSSTAAGSKAVMSGKYAIMRRMETRKNDKNLIKVLENIDSSVKYGSKMNLIGKENLNADTLAYALAKNKRFAINKLDENTAKVLGFKYSQDVRRSIDPSDVIHTLNRHGIDSNLVKLSGQKPVTLDDTANIKIMRIMQRIKA